MRIEHKYNRNQAYRVKHWKRIRRQTNPYEYTHGAWYYTSEEQVKEHLEWVTKQSRAIENGSHKNWNHASKHFRQTLWKRRKAQERNVMARIRLGDYDAEMPAFKSDADWEYF